MERSGSKYSDIIGIVALAALGGLIVWKLLTPPQGAESSAVAVGQPLPPISVAGWLNVPAGQSFDPAGKVLVVDLWATWCQPCRRAIPELAKVAQRYRPQGVEFVGLTSETEEDLPRIQEFLDDTPQFDWPVGYGAMEFWNALEVDGIPMLVVYGADGRARWSRTGMSSGTMPALEAALDEALLAAGRAAEPARDPG